MELETSNLMMYFIPIILIIEQVLYLSLSSYICRFGIPITSIPISATKAFGLFSEENKYLSGVKKRINQSYNEIYFRYSYPIIMWGPFLFVGQVKKQSPTTLQVRVGIFTAAFLIMLIISNSFSSNFSLYDLISNVIIIIFILYCFARFRRCINRNLID